MTDDSTRPDYVEVTVSPTDYSRKASPVTQNVTYTTTTAPEPELDTQALHAILEMFGKPSPSVVEKLKKSYKDKNGRWHEMELDYIGHATLTKWLIFVDPAWNWEPVAWDNGRPKIHVQGDTAELWIRLTVLGKTVIGVGTASASKSDLSKELIGDALRNAGMRLGFATALWSKSEWDEPATVTAAPDIHEPVNNTQIAEIIDDPFEWAHHSMLEATSVTALDAVAGLAKKRLTEEQRAELRPIYLARKAELEGASA